MKTVDVYVTISPPDGALHGQTYVKRVEMSFDGRVVRMKGGPTGHESFILHDDSIEALSGGWVACAGGMGWPRCEVSGSEMHRFFMELRG